MTDRKSNRAGPPMSREQLGGADPKLAAAFIAFAEKLGRKTKAMSESADSPGDAKRIKTELKSDTEDFLKMNKRKP